MAMVSKNRDYQDSKPLSIEEIRRIAHIKILEELAEAKQNPFPSFSTPMDKKNPDLSRLLDNNQEIIESLTPEIIECVFDIATRIDFTERGIFFDKAIYRKISDNIGLKIRPSENHWEETLICHFFRPYLNLTDFIIPVDLGERCDAYLIRHVDNLVNARTYCGYSDFTKKAKKFIQEYLSTELYTLEEDDELLTPFGITPFNELYAMDFGITQRYYGINENKVNPDILLHKGIKGEGPWKNLAIYYPAIKKYTIALALD
jgi:hypothetical protein